MQWTAYDWFMAVGLIALCIAAWLVGVCRWRERRQRAVLAAVLVVGFLLVWVEGAVGIFD